MDKEIRIKVTIFGKTLLMHNGQLADPMNEYTKELKKRTQKKKKSDDDQLDIAQAEFVGGLYFDDALGPVIPSDLLDAVMIHGARRKKLGKEFAPNVRCVDLVHKLDYKGPRTREALWKEPRHVDRRGVKVGQSRVIRTRPRFDDWRVSFEVLVNPCALNVDDVREAIDDAGKYVGLGDYRPRFGCFAVESFEEI